MSTDGEKKLTRYTSAVTVVTAEVMNSLFGGEYGHNTDLGDFHPLVSGHIHDGEHADGHASKILLTNGQHVRGYLSHANLGGTDGTIPAVQAENIQCYDETIYGDFGGGNAIPEYIEDEDGNRCYYLDLSMTVGGDDTQIQYNENGEFSGSPDLTFGYNTGNEVKIGHSSGANLSINYNSNMSSPHLLLIEDAGSNHGSRISFVNKSDNSGPHNHSHEWTLYGKSASEGSADDAVFNIWYGDADGAGNGGDILVISGDRLVGINKTPTVELDVDGSGSFTGDVIIDGKLTVAGLIDPTGLILTEEEPENVPTKAGDGAIFVAGGVGGVDDKGNPLEQNKLYYKDATGSIMDLRGARSLSELEDVSLGDAQPPSGRVLKYDGVDDKWKAMPDEAGSPADPNWSIQYNANGEFEGDSSVILKNSCIGIGVTETEGPARRLHVKDQENPPVRLDSLPRGTGHAVVWDENSGDLFHKLQDVLIPKIVTWPVNGDIVLDAADRFSFIIVGGPYNGSGKVVVPSSPQDGPWNHGDYIWIKNMTYTSGSGMQLSSGSGHALEVCSDNPSDTLDLQSFYTPYLVPPKNTIRICCVQDDALGNTGSNHWFLVSHYHELSYTLDSPPRAEIKVTIPNPNNPDNPTVVSNHGTITGDFDITFSGLLSDDPDGDAIEEYSWTLSSSSGTFAEEARSTSTFVIPSNKLYDETVTVKLKVKAKGQDSTEVTFDATVYRGNTGPVAVITSNTTSGQTGDRFDVSGTSSYDSDGDSLTYAWTLLAVPSGSSVTLSGQNTNDSISVYPDIAGEYRFQLIVNDGQEDSSPAIFAMNISQANTAPTITILGEISPIINEGSSYTDAGATAYDAEDLDISGSIVTTGLPIDTSTAGTYQVKYNVSDSQGVPAPEVIRTVTVNAKPVITLVGQATVSVIQGSSYTDAGATAYDAEDLDISGSIVTTGLPVDTSTAGTYQVKYNVSDSRGLGATQKIRTVTVTANEAPVITLVGEATVSVNQGSSYTDAGATAYDAEDLDISESIVTTGLPVDTSTAGTYQVKYNVTDSFGNDASEIVRTVVVNAIPTINVSPSSVDINEGDTYGEAEIRSGVTASDDEDGDLTSQVTYSSNVNTSTPGSYTVIYNLTDSNGAAATPVIRTVNVNRLNVGPTVGTITVSGGSDVRDTYNLSATITDDDGYVKTKLWQIKSSPSNANVTLNPPGLFSGNYGQSTVAEATFSTDTPGSYTVQLTATDDDNDAGINSKTFTVNAIPSNQPPISRMRIGQGKVGGVVDSNALGNISFKDYGSTSYIEIDAAPSNTVFFDASQSTDSDGTVRAWNWYLDCPAQSLFQPIKGVKNPPPSNLSSGLSPYLGYYPDEFGRQVFYFRPDVSGSYVVNFLSEDDSGDTSQLITVKITMTS